MIKPHSKIIAVDNQEEELSLLLKTLNEIRIPCLPVLYEVGDTLEEKFNGIRIAFFDINLAEGHNSGAKLHSIIADALSQVLDPANGPFALIFWTKHQTEIADIIAYIQDPKRGIEVPFPLVIDCIDKGKIANKEALIPELERVLSNPTLNALLDYEENAQKAASDTIDSIFSIVPGYEQWGDFSLFDSNFKNVISKMAADSLGYGHAKKNPTKSIHFAFSPILNYNLKNIQLNEDAWAENLKPLSDSHEAKELSYPLKFDIGNLNSIYHLILPTDVHTKDHRGIILNCEVDSSKFNEVFNHSYEEIRDIFLPIKPKIDEKQKLSIYEQIEFVFIEISAACDFSQNNKRASKYILGLKFPQSIERAINKPKDSVFKTPLFTIDGASFYIYVNFNFVLGLNPTDAKLGEMRFCFSEDMTNMIGNRYANYTSRIGIVSY